ncbi:glyoxalase [beta proteobacterium AAP121]|nr:glyoxalase [beta proteobacterium AAP65]KPF95419.1 glyoxalase [beta proteobacterium AAP121]
MDVFKTHGAFSWSELTTPDPAAAAAFYGELFGWSVKAPDPNMADYRVASLGETMVAGICAPFPDAPPAPPHWGAYVTVDNADASAAKCAALGGKVLVPPMDVPTVGRMAVLQDPQGAVFSVMTYSES